MKRKLVMLLLTIMLQQLAADAQLNPLGAVYFQNQYLGNPALAGIQKGLVASIQYRQQWSQIPGTPITQAGTAEYRKGNVGIGVNINNDKAGLVKRNRAMATYAYHLLLGARNQQLSFGISLGFVTERIDYSELNGDPNDIQVADYNSHKAYVDSDFGLAYTTAKFNLQMAVPNLKELFGKNYASTADGSVVYITAGYKFNTDIIMAGTTLEPHVAYRGIKNAISLIDLGANAELIDQTLNMFAIYHSTQNATTGIGMRYKAIMISGMYTSATSALKNYTRGNFEIGMKIRAF